MNHSLTARFPVIVTAALLAIGVAATLFISTASAQTDDARLRVLHASPDAPAVDIYVDGAETISELAFGDITEYLALPAGDYKVQVFPASADGGGSPVIDTDVTLSSATDYTVAAVGLLADIEPLVLVDDNTAPATGQARLRFVHASPDAPAVDIYADGAGVVVADASFKDASGYLDLADGTYDLDVRAAGTETVALGLPGVTLEAGTTYTAFALGLLNGEPALTAKLTVDSAAQQTTASPSPTASPASAPTSGGPMSSGGTDWALWIAIAGAGLVLAAIAGTTGLVAARSRTR